jgi:hypothetical protein
MKMSIRRCDKGIGAFMPCSIKLKKNIWCIL